jgi:hypothetical protein
LHICDVNQLIGFLWKCETTSSLIFMDRVFATYKTDEKLGILWSVILASMRTQLEGFRGI